ncbi:MAG: SEC-C domain-containing protein [Lachnospiraceae bacterium]|nr:SEC-C domain-containing protein [Lachnospiraceae bacterium]
MSLISEWRDMAYSATANKGDLQRLWQDYFQKEKEIYAQLLADTNTEVKGTVEELAEKYGITLMYMTGFLDGINDSLKVANDIEAMEKDTEVSLGFDKEKLFRNMVDAKADWLYGLPEWDDIYSKEEQEELIKDQKKSHTFVREGRKVGRNEPCPCGSGKKYKNCCGRDA